jgi:DNA-directed RNA polymerase, mitochondrial
MMLTAMECQRRGLAFAGVHDSFWTHAADIPECRDIIREQFVELYSRPILEQLKLDLESSARASPAEMGVPDAVADGLLSDDDLDDHADRDVRVNVAAVPTRGKFDIREVLKSTYFFN